VVCYALLFVTLLIFWTAYIAHQSSLLGYAYRTDFVGIYVGAHTVAAGHAAQLYDLDTQRAEMNQAVLPFHRAPLMAFIYPAYVAVLLAPVGALSFVHAVVVMLTLNILIAVRILWLIATRFSDSRRVRLTLLFAFLAFVPLHLTLLQNQLGLFPALGILQAVVAFRDQQPTRAGFWLLLGIFKPQLILFPLLAIALWRCWKTLLPFVVGCIAVLALSVSVLGWWIPTYLSFLRDYNRAGSAMSLFPQAMQNWRGLAYVLLQPGYPKASLLVVLALSSASVIAIVILCGSDAKDSSVAVSQEQWEARFGIVVLLGVVSSPHLYLHDWVVFLPSAILLGGWSRTLPARPFWPRRIFFWLLAGSPFLFTFSHFIAWSPFGMLQWVPWYMGTLALAALLSLNRADSAAIAPNLEAT
jgi:hypothetical protein